MPQLRRKKAPRISRRRPPTALSLLKGISTEAGRLGKKRLDPEAARLLYDAKRFLELAAKAQERAEE